MRARHILGFILVLMGLRLVFLLGSLDPSQEPVREIMDQAGVTWYQGPERPLYDREELYTATAAEAIRMGLDLPLDTYRFMAYGSGSLLISLLAVPIYILFGPQYLAFKIIPLLVTLVGGLAWWRVVHAWAGARAGWLFGLLYLFGPSVIVRTALISKGDHAEAMAIVGVVLWTLTRAAFAPSARGRARWAFVGGVLTGLGVYVTYSTVPVVAGALLGAVLLTRLRPLAPWIHGGAGLVIGLVPWLIVIQQTGGSALRVYDTGLADAGFLAEAGHRIQLLLTTGFLAHYDLPGGEIPRRLGGLLLTLAVVASWIVLLRQLRRPARAAAVLTLLGTLAFLAAFCLRAPDASSRYLLPGYPLLLASVALWAGGSLPDRASVGSRRAGWIAAVVLTVMGLAAQAASVADSRFVALRAPLRGTDWPLLGEIAGQKLTPDQIARLPERVRPYFWVGFGTRMQFEAAPAQWRQIAGVAGEDEARWVYQGLGVGLAQVPGWERTASAVLPTLAPEHREALRRGIARYADEYLPQLTVVYGPELVDRVIGTLAPQDQPEIAAAAARVTAVLATHGVEMGREAPAASRGAYVETIQSTPRMAAAAGWSLWRDAGSGGAPRFWSPPPASWTADYARALEAGRAPAASWAGVAQAYERTLRTRSARWLLGDKDGPRTLARELRRLLDAVPSDAREGLLRAAGRACGAAQAMPTLDTAPPVAEWDWENALDASWREPFRQGLRTPTLLPR